MKNSTQIKQTRIRSGSLLALGFRLTGHLEFLSGRYALIPFSELIEALLQRDFSALPPQSLVVRIDDGYAKNRELLEVLQRHEVRPTLFLCSFI